MLLSREECRSGEAPQGFKDQSEAIALQADCIEAGIYDPCEDSGSRWGDAQCAWANLHVAERRIRTAEQSLIASAQKSKPTGRLQNELNSSGERWKAARERFCEERDQLVTKAEEAGDAEQTDSGEKLGYCMRRVTEERALELERFADRLRGGQAPAELKELLAYLRAKPRFTPG